MATTLNWSDAKILAISGAAIRRADWTHWIFYRRGVWMLFSSLGTPAVVAKRVVTSADFGSEEFLATDWTDEATTEVKAASLPAVGSVGTVTVNAVAAPVVQGGSSGVIPATPSVPVPIAGPVIRNITAHLEPPNSQHGWTTFLFTPGQKGSYVTQWSLVQDNFADSFGAALSPGEIKGPGSQLVTFYKNNKAWIAKLLDANVSTSDIDLMEGARPIPPFTDPVFFVPAASSVSAKNVFQTLDGVRGNGPRPVTITMTVVDPQ